LDTLNVTYYLFLFKQSEPSTSTAGSNRPKKETDPEKTAKVGYLSFLFAYPIAHIDAIQEKERLEKKAAKTEKEKKEKEAQNKSRSIMANFFGKPKASSARASPAQESTATGVGSGFSSSPSEFEKMFKPFVVKKDAAVAPANWFLDPKTNKLHRRRGSNRDVVVIDADDAGVEEVVDVEVDDVQEVPSSDSSQMHTEGQYFGDVRPYLGFLYLPPEHLASILSFLPPSADASFTAAPRRRLSAPRHITRTILSQLSEAEIVDNPSRVRSLLSVLRNRELLPAKVLIFTEDARPGYFGTWTRHSRIIGPRTPFARDLVALDYAYDSGGEWEEERTGDADDVVEGAEEEDGATEADSDLDSWLVDDDDVGEIGTPLEEREADPLPAVLNFPAKRKAEDGERKIGKKRKVVVPLVPFAKGPCWESEIGNCPYEPFEPYQIQLFNGVPCLILLTVWH
jgi:chromatin assembly factor 1 subunit A